MAKFDNLKGLLDELERIYDDPNSLQGAKNDALEAAIRIWENRAPLDLMIGWMGGIVETARKSHMDTSIQLDKVMENLKKWYEADKKQAAEKEPK